MPPARRRRRSSQPPRRAYAWSSSRPATSATRVVTAASNWRGACSIHGLWPSTVDPTLQLLTETESDETLSARPPPARSAPAAAPSRLSPSEDRDRTADPAAGRCNGSAARQAVSAVSLAARPSAAQPAPAQRLQLRGTALERQTGLLEPLPARWALARPLPSDSRCPRAAALCQQPCQCGSHQSISSPSSPAWRGSNGAGLTSVALGRYGLGRG